MKARLPKGYGGGGASQSTADCASSTETAGEDGTNHSRTGGERIYSFFPAGMRFMQL
jgi:hypothetical protein